MNKLRKYIITQAIVGIILFFNVGYVYSQVPFEQGGGRPEMGGSGPEERVMMGEVLRIDNKSITIVTQKGDEKEFVITQMTSFSKEMKVDKSQIKIGDVLFMMPPEGEPFIVKILSDKDEIMKRPPSFPQGAVEGPKISGPPVGKVVGVDPLTVDLESGQTRVVKISERTQLLKELPVGFEEIRKGAKVSVMPLPGTGMGREAIKIIISPQDSSKGGPMGTPSSRGDTDRWQSDSEATFIRRLLPDILQQPLKTDFIFALWLGRGFYSNNELEIAFKVANNLGVKYFKIEILWGYVESENNRWRWNDKNTLDVEHVIKLAKQYKMSIIPYFDLEMPWGKVKHPDPAKSECLGMPSARGQYQAPDPEEYAEYVFAVVDKLKREGVDVKYIELDNEDSGASDGYTIKNCFRDLTAKQLKEAENAAYDKVKAVYPDVMISSTTFPFPGLGCGHPQVDCEFDKKIRNVFIKAYFEDSPRPKFDFLGIHETIGGSGNPYTTYNKPLNAIYQYNFGSYYDAYDMWREILNKYGYKNAPIFNTESEGGIPGRNQEAHLLQKMFFAKTQAPKNNIIGVVIAQITMSDPFFSLLGGKPDRGIVLLKDGYPYKMYEGYYAFYTLMSTFAKYPYYKGKIMGELNKQTPWVEKFGDDKGNTLFAAFIPYSFISTSFEMITLDIGKNKEVKIIKSEDASISIQSTGNKRDITIKITQSPILIEVL